LHLKDVARFDANFARKSRFPQALLTQVRRWLYNPAPLPGKYHPRAQRGTPGRRAIFSAVVERQLLV
jgi:hypothetical protein